MRSRLLFIAVLLAAPSLAAAQGLAGPFSGLFGRVPERIGKHYTAIDFRSTIGGQYDDAIVDDGTPAESAPRSGSTGGANAGLSFERRSDRLRSSAYGIATHQQFFRDPSFAATSYDSGALLTARLATRLALEGSVSYRRAPFYQLLPAASGIAPISAVLVPGEAFAARRLDHDTLDGMVGFSSPYTRRSTVSASVSRRATRFFNEPDHNFGLWGAKGMWTRKMTRDVAARIGYGREEISQTGLGEGRFIHEVFDVGLDLAREFSVARRTVFTVTTQTSMIRETGGDRRYRLNGSVVLARGFRRTWAASLAATRNTEFLPGFLAPVFSDGASGTISGMLADRIEWSAALAASRGRVGFEAPGHFINYTGTSRLSAGMTRHLGVYAEYSYYRYELPPGASAVVLLPQLSRQSVSVGLSAYVPVFFKVRAPRDSR